MRVEELRFFLEKAVTIFSTLLSLKRPFLLEVYRAVEAKLFGQGGGNNGGNAKERYTKSEFIKLMTILTKELASVVEEVGAKSEHFCKQLRSYRLPEFLEPGNLFLGKYLVREVVSYNQIIDKGLLAGDSVFGRNNSSPLP